MNVMEVSDKGRLVLKTMGGGGGFSFQKLLIINR